MTTVKQIEANRQNAQQSTGPLSIEGKAIVAQNAIKHGILSAYVFVRDDEVEIYENFCKNMLKNFNPRGDMENFLVDRIITTAWRLRRIIHIETLIFEEAYKCPYGRSYSEVFITNSAGNMAILSRYESSLENVLYRAIKEFRVLQEQDGLEIVEATTCKNGFVS